MKLKRLIQSLNGYFEELVKCLENHEAVAEGAINDIRKHTAKLKVQLKQTQVRLSQLEAQKLDLERSCKMWRKRAKQAAHTDKEKALRCMQALKNKESLIILLDEQIQNTKYLENDLQEHVLKAEQKLSELSTKKSHLSARASRTRVKQAGRVAYPYDIEQDDIFVRWEEKILADELTGKESCCSDESDRNYKIVDDKLSLELELEALLTEDET